MDTALITLAIVVIVSVAGVWLGTKLASRTGARGLKDLPAEQRRRARLTIGALLAIYVPATAVSVWALTSGHVGVGIAVLVAAFVLPDFVVVPLRVRRSRQVAKATERRRRGVG